MMTRLPRLAALSLVLILSGCSGSEDASTPAEQDVTAAAQDTAAPIKAGDASQPDDDSRWVEVADLPETNIFGTTWTGDYAAHRGSPASRGSTVRLWG